MTKENKAAELAQATTPKTPKTPRAPKSILNVRRDERVAFEAQVRVNTKNTLEKYAEFSGASVGDVVDSLAEMLEKKDRLFREWLLKGV